MAESRLFQMLFLLLEKGSITAPELAEHFEVSVRTIYRDIDNLSAAGIPVYMTPGKGGGIFLQENYVLNRSLISEQEQRQILLSLHGLGAVDEESADDLLKKLGGIFQKQNLNWIEVDFSEWNRKSERTYHTLRSAIFNQKVVALTYYGSNGKSERRLAEPLKLLFKNREWYLYAFCRNRQDYRLFKLVRIRELEQTEQDFERAAPERVIEEITEYQGELTEIVLSFDRSLAYRVFENFEEVEEDEQRNYIVHAMWPESESLYSFLLFFGDKMKVIAPARIRDNMKMRIQKMYENYRT